MSSAAPRTTVGPHQPDENQPLTGTVNTPPRPCAAVSADDHTGPVLLALGRLR